MPVTLRPATASDQKPIKDLIHLVGINPTGLNWERFIIAEEAGQFVGCVQLKPIAMAFANSPRWPCNQPIRAKAWAANSFRPCSSRIPASSTSSAARLSRAITNALGFKWCLSLNFPTVSNSNTALVACSPSFQNFRGSALCGAPVKNKRRTFASTSSKKFNAQLSC